MVGAVATETEVARTAAAAISTLWTYTPDTIDTLPDRASKYLCGDFDALYRKFLQAAIMPNKQAQVTDKTNVVGVAVESLKGSDADTLVLTNTTATSPLTKNIPSMKDEVRGLPSDDESTGLAMAGEQNGDHQLFGFEAAPSYPSWSTAWAPPCS
ncbi:hypothetical protein [Candidatus Mycobacterium methanotrophicum]|uniref:hypothetical protein n=1 Tax=Candidatus Mycobacterium methanotrophicum TaxID=2943498 RepID=UPI001C559E4E